MKYFVNYSYDAITNKFQLFNVGGKVIATEKFAIIDSEMRIKEPLIVPTDNVFDIVVDKETYEKDHRVFNLKMHDDGTFEETTEQEADVRRWFTKDTDVSKLRLINGKILMVETNERVEKKRDKTKEN